MSQPVPTAEQIRNARRAGFTNSVSHMPQERREKLEKSYVKQDDRRERNVAGFYKTVTGDK